MNAFVRDDRFSTLPGVPIVIKPLLNDDPGDSLFTLFAVGPAGSPIVQLSDTLVQYTPQPGFTGTELLTYKAELEVENGFNQIFDGKIFVDVFPDNFSPQAVTLDPISVYEPFVFINLAAIVDPGDLVDESSSLWSSGGANIETNYPDTLAVVDPGQFLQTLSPGEEAAVTLTIRAEHDAVTTFSTVEIPVFRPPEEQEPYTGPALPDLSGNGVADMFDFATAAEQGVTIDADLDSLQAAPGTEVIAILETFSGASIFVEGQDPILSVFGEDVRQNSLTLLNADTSAAEMESDRFAAFFASQAEADAALQPYQDQFDNSLAVINFALADDILGVAPADFTTFVDIF